MAETLRQPKAYRPGLGARLRDGLRYSGGVGQRAWLVHRITGLGIVLFLVIHIVDTFFVVAFPGLYDHTVSIYGGVVSGLGPGIDGYYWPLRWAFRIGELFLIACVLFHALNGVRVALVDLWPRATRVQRQMFAAVVVLFWAIMIPVSVLVFVPLLEAPNHWKMPEAVETSGPMPAP